MEDELSREDSNSTILVNGKKVEIKNKPLKLITLDALEEMVFFLLASRETGLVTKDQMIKSLQGFMDDFDRQLRNRPFAQARVFADILAFVDSLKLSGEEDISNSGLLSLKKRALGKNKVFVSNIIGRELLSMMENDAKTTEPSQEYSENSPMDKYGSKTPDEQFEMAQYYSSKEVKDFEEAIGWYQSCKDSNYKCGFQLGIMTYLGVGMEPDQGLGLLLIDDSIDKGDDQHLLKVIKFIDSRIDIKSNTKETMEKLKQVKDKAFQRV